MVVVVVELDETWPPGVCRPNTQYQLWRSCPFMEGVPDFSHSPLPNLVHHFLCSVMSTLVT